MIHLLFLVVAVSSTVVDEFEFGCESQYAIYWFYDNYASLMQQYPEGQLAIHKFSLQTEWLPHPDAADPQWLQLPLPVHHPEVNVPRLRTLHKNWLTYCQNRNNYDAKKGDFIVMERDNFVAASDDWDTAEGIAQLNDDRWVTQLYMENDWKPPVL
eukprot:TRINITY_DN67893_c13_g1_i1.p1 TRINITY_DN67893_c13_g1~~TRINITY_DN67893_c13_g1_i1.p1  ORF type:complete len:156 (+),score=14.79 TRINITY_DN67893_c13_g1_i1:59-526(+)